MSNRSWVAAVTVAVALGVGACQVRTRYWQPNTSVSNSPEERIVGITTRSGVVEVFDRRAAVTVKDQTLYARISRKPFQIALSDVERYWVETHHVSVVRTVGLVAAVGTAVAIVVAVATHPPSFKLGGMGGGGCCLFVYSWDGQRYSFDTEAYTAAITRGIERDDYSWLPHLREQDGQYRLMISNEMDETQYTNLLELWVVDHAPGVQPRVGDDGRLYSISAPLTPLSARDGDGNDVRPWLEKRDQLIWEPEPAPDRNSSLNREIVMTFPRPPQARQAKLVASATYTLWSGYMGGQILHLLGPGLPAWYREIDENPSARNDLLAWMARERLYALNVEVEEAGGWQPGAVLPVAGPFVSDERVTTLDLSRVTGSELRIRLRPPAGFWALNSFAVDYSQESPLSVTRVPLESVRDEQGNDLLPALTRVDDRYHEMSATGERAFVAFPAPPRRPGQDRTIFLHSRGYYKMHVPEDGEPNRTAFERILQEPGAGARLSAERYAGLRQSQRAVVNSQR
jgi:hypothetical protein